MIETGTGANRSEVGCLTRLDEGMIEVRLHPTTPGARRVAVLAEPSALQYARLRVRMMDANQELSDKFPEPTRPHEKAESESDWEAVQRFAAYETAVAQWLDDRTAHRLDPEHAPYAQAFIEVINELAGVEITLGDVTPEAFKAPTLQALLEAWEAPLGGGASPFARTPGIHEDRSAVPPLDLPPLDSPESTPSSPPGGDLSSPSQPPSSME